MGASLGGMTTDRAGVAERARRCEAAPDDAGDADGDAREEAGRRAAANWAAKALLLRGQSFVAMVGDQLAGLGRAGARWRVAGRGELSCVVGEAIAVSHFWGLRVSDELSRDWDVELLAGDWLGSMRWPQMAAYLVTFGTYLGETWVRPLQGMVKKRLHVLDGCTLCQNA